MFLSKSNITSLFARIELQGHFCENCQCKIETQLKNINGVNNIKLYSRDSLLTFNYKEINNISSVLNILTEIGYPEKGEHFLNNNFYNTVCNC